MSNRHQHAHHHGAATILERLQFHRTRSRITYILFFQSATQQSVERTDIHHGTMFNSMNVIQVEKQGEMDQVHHSSYRRMNTRHILDVKEDNVNVDDERQTDQWIQYCLISTLAVRN